MKKKHSLSRLVWTKYKSNASKKLAMLLIADLSSGRIANPSIEFIALRCGVSHRQAQYIIRDLIAEGSIFAVCNNSGGKPGATRGVVINEQALTGAVDCTPTGEVYSTPRKKKTGAVGCTQGVSSKHRPQTAPIHEGEIAPRLRVVSGGAK